MICSYDRYLKSPPDGVMTLEYIEERKIYSHMTTINFYEEGIEAYENILLQLKTGDEEARGVRVLLLQCWHDDLH